MIQNLAGVRKGSCEGPIHFLFVMQAMLETIEWPDEHKPLSFMTAITDGKLNRESVRRKRGASIFQMDHSIYADDLVCLSTTRELAIQSASILSEHSEIWSDRSCCAFHHRPIEICLHVLSCTTLLPTRRLKSTLINKWYIYSICKRVCVLGNSDDTIFEV